LVSEAGPAVVTTPPSGPVAPVVAPVPAVAPGADAPPASPAPPLSPAAQLAALFAETEAETARAQAVEPVIAGDAPAAAEPPVQSSGVRIIGPVAPETGTSGATATPAEANSGSPANQPATLFDLGEPPAVRPEPMVRSVRIPDGGPAAASTGAAASIDAPAV